MGVKSIWSRQVQVLEALARHDRVAVRSGHKVGKSTSAGLLSAWWVGTRPRGRVVMTSGGFRQVKDILWRELRRLVREAPRPLGGKFSIDPSSGWKFNDGREIVGLSTDDPDKIAGYSGDQLLFIIDEAPGVPQEIFEALEGNRASDGTKIIMFGNPTQMSGTFYDAFHTKSRFWHTIHISSEESPNVTGEMKIPGLAGPGWIAEKRDEWGEESALYQVRVRGNFPAQGTNAVIALHLVTKARDQWKAVKAEGRLNIGVDVARFGDDESVIIGRRGLKQLPKRILKHNRGNEVLGEVLKYAREYRQDNERPLVKVDGIGLGSTLVDFMRQEKEVETRDVNVSEVATAEGYVKLRDQLWFGIAEYFKAGGTIEPDDAMDQELVAPVYGFDGRGKQKVDGKDAIKKIIKRSPDRADALALAIYEPPAERKISIRITR